MKILLTLLILLLTSLSYAGQDIAVLDIDQLNGASPGFPTSSTDNAVVRFDGTSGSAIQNSTVTVSDSGVVTLSGLILSSSAISCASNVCTDVAASYAVYITTQSDLTPDVLAIADGVAGQEKLIVLKGAGTDDLTITPTHYGSGTSITCTTTGFSAKLHFDGSSWQVVALFGCTDD